MKARPTLSSLCLLVACGLLLIVVWLMPTASSEGAVPHMINYQGKLTTASGGCLNDTVQMTFSIYPDTTGSPADWIETQNSVIVKEGIFNVLLGSVDSIPDTVFNGSVKYLGVQVESDPEMRPLKPIVSVAYAFKSFEADTANYVRVSMPDDDWIIAGDNIYRLNGNVGIGTTEPSGKLHVKAGYGGVKLEAPASSYSDIAFIDSSSPGSAFRNWVIRAHAGDDWGRTLQMWSVAGGPLAIIDANVGIGTADPNAKLHVSGGDVQVSSGRIYNSYTHPNDYSANIVTYNLTGNWTLGLWNYGNGTRGVFSSVSSDGSEPKIGVFGAAGGDAGTRYGVYGFSGSDSPDSDPNYAIYGATSWLTSQSYAGYFVGNVHVNNTLSKGAGSFKIDHPLDPENKYLYHSFVESPDMMNVYNGNVILNAKGEAAVELPDYFDALNRDFRYQLTAIGAPGPNLYIADKITNNSFKIAGGEPGMEVSWQVTGIRKDPFAEANRISVEVDKPAKEQGKYLHPEAYGLGGEYGIHYEEHKRMEEKQWQKRARKMEKR